LSVRVPITNVYGGGDYTAQIKIGSEEKLANVILDTGSSTLAVSPNVYDPNTDVKVKKTPLAQDVRYGSGGWTGPVLQTEVAIGEGAEAVPVKAYIALTDEQEAQGFSPADGILGLAYNKLNEAHNLEAYLHGQGVAPPHTFPWPFPIENSSVALQQFAAFLERMPKEDLTPYFTALEQAKVDKNIFAFYTLRSVLSARTGEPAGDPLNNGFFILGGGEEQKDLYEGEFESVDVVDDAYYNTDLLYVQVEGGEKIEVPKLPRQLAKSMRSNSIVDSGTNSLRIFTPVFEAIVASLERIDPTFGAQLKIGIEEGLPVSQLDLVSWPNIVFTLRGEQTGEEVSLKCAPSTYWQLHAPEAGKAQFVIYPTREPQSILGLPLLNNYFTVFDRTQDPYGAIRFAAIKPGATGKVQ
jgi:hypothetical protein